MKFIFSCVHMFMGRATLFKKYLITAEKCILFDPLEINKYDTCSLVHYFRARM